ncbi:hypothetical protein F5144DRAFT_324045 [Chaetomium tenue]|uniref:Uncharacterized protein n=1 Tax=Chaetomium tenue TaxID=1854479 RepID=A0ACB7P3W8_9PEZI|nr:hypothetical protein F5144DRAFT_324045 [Chaetomium globosum]
MDTHDDPSATTTTTDYDSGDSVIIAYVYEGQKATERRSTKGRSPRRKRSPKPKQRGLAKCTCGAGRAEDEDEITVFEEDTDTEEERARRRRSTKPRPSGAGVTSGCDAKDHHKVDKKKTTESKTRRVQTPYIEDYPDDAPRPTIILREHRLLRRSSTSDTRRVRDSEDCSPSGSRDRSSLGKRLPPRPPRHSSKESPKHPKSHRRHHHHHHTHETHENKSSGSEVKGFQSDSGESGLNAHRPRYDPISEPASTVARSSAWNDNSQPEYSSSWPRHGESHLPQRQLEYGDRDHDSEEGSDEHSLNYNSNYDYPRRLLLRGAPSFQEQIPEKQLERHRELLQQATPPPEHERGNERERPAPSPRRPRTVISSTSMATTEQGYRSVATSVCEVWRGKAEDWESPYVSASDGDYESDAEEPIQLLRMEDLPPRRSSPRLLPPRGERREFGFRPTPPPPPPYPRHHPAYMAEDSFHPDQTWPASNRDGLLLLEGPLALTMELDAMTDDEDDVHRQHGMQLQSRESSWSRPGPPKSWTYPLSPRPRAVSPVFSARRTREFLSPTPTRAARFDFDAWGCGRSSRSSLALALR